ncbi:hypothetical protein OO013_03160 [Mangrovivirga sp. M17]|uniref:Uncharacterized protein n=1 Tax=Mangrovivirga halotolerans TaxID=2993936 RepID=A0ABT3RMW1_9BACT|nr:DUF6588 family protein [Mangrovivirga halotolerans]MCX2742848.1 hypothetical protein [Mangrovivirga halotolerans]
MRLLIIFSFCLLLNFPAFTQENEIRDLTRSGPEDLNQYIENYTRSFVVNTPQLFSYGWFNTPHLYEKFNFDLSINYSSLNISEADKSFLFKNSEYSNLRYTSADEVELASLLGVVNPSDNITIIQTGEVLNVPGGVNLNSLPAPIIQAGIGFNQASLKLRFLPGYDQDGVSFFGWGVGAMYDFSKMILKEKYDDETGERPIDLAVLIGYTRFRGKTDLSEDNISSDDEARLIIQNLTTQLILGKQMDIFNIYAGISGNFNSGNTKITGTYTYEDPETNSEKEYTDPVDQFYSDENMSALLGMDIQLAVFSIHGQYHFIGYRGFSVGFGLSLK